MDVPWQYISGLAAGFAYFANHNGSSWPRLSYASAFLAGWLLIFFIWGLWTVLVYPRYFSPLRHLPGPENASLLHGQWSRIRAEPTGAPHIDWWVIFSTI
jgi:hypothetical protein